MEDHIRDYIAQEHNPDHPSNRWLNPPPVEKKIRRISKWDPKVAAPVRFRRHGSLPPEKYAEVPVSQ